MSTKTKTNKSKSKETMAAVRTMVEFMKDEVDRAIVSLSSQDKISSENAQSVSNVIKMSIESAFIKTSSQVQKAVE